MFEIVSGWVKLKDQWGCKIVVNEKINLKLSLDLIFQSTLTQGDLEQVECDYNLNRGL